MTRKKRRLRGRNAQRREAYTMEKYDTRALHEEREYGLFWYAWLWKILRPVLIFMCSALIVVGMVTVAWNKVYDTFLAPMDTMSAELVTFEVESGSTVSGIAEQLVEAKLLRNESVF